MNTKRGLMENVPCMMLQAKPLRMRRSGVSLLGAHRVLWREGKSTLCFTAAAYPVYIPPTYIHRLAKTRLPWHPTLPPTTLHTALGKQWHCLWREVSSIHLHCHDIKAAVGRPFSTKVFTKCFYWHFGVATDGISVLVAL